MTTTALGAPQLAQRQGHRLRQRSIARVVQTHEVSDHLRVGIGLEHDPFGLQLRAQLAKVFDDAVLHNNKPAQTVGVGMRVALAGLAMGGPARVTDADMTRNGRLGQFGRKVAELADIAPDGDAASPWMTAMPAES